ncbi:MAG: M3 family oligoendopeptidase [Clostridiales bacterium]|jgi:pepF/M3 family oligoendopeptidase|nr:M3 family oligoendopeptidase [Clostridiales bacterium]
MNKEWSLDVLYRGFNDEKYHKDKEELVKLTLEMKAYSEGLNSGPQKEEDLIKAVEYLEQYHVLSYRLISYTVLMQSTNTSDSEITNQVNEIEKQVSEASKPLTVLKKYIARAQNLQELYDRYPKLKSYEYLIAEMREEANHLLSDDVEDVIAKLNISAGSAWNSMQSFLTSTLEVEYKGQVVTLPEIRNLAYDKDPTVRKEAYEAELKSLEKIKDAVSFSLNNIKTQVNTISDLRGYPSPLEMTLKQSRMKKETLDALLQAIKEYLPAFHRYLKHKAKVLGHVNGLPWYDIFAPMGESSRQFTIEEAKDYLIKHFSNFAQDMGDMIQEAFDNEWIDFYPRKGKVGGAFCENIPFVKQSRILTNFTGNFGDVVTLAHELGHAYHGMMIQDHLPLNTDYSMPVAETASTFNEAIVMEFAIKEADSKEKLALIEDQLQNVTQIIVDIYSRYLFESEVFEKSRNGFLFADQLSDIMLQAQKEAYGDGLDSSVLHQYMWIVKGHYYSENLSFYNFPYAFGGLFARGLYEKYKEEGEVFLPKYRALLKATTVMSVEDAAKEAEINLEDPEFWRTSLRSYEKMIDEFIKLS